jgi:hypothetical protein
MFTKKNVMKPKHKYALCSGLLFRASAAKVLKRYSPMAVTETRIVRGPSNSQK